MTQFQIKKGLSTNLFDDQGRLLIVPEEGCWYITTDTFELYACFNGVLESVGQVKDFETRLQALEYRTARIVRSYETKANLPVKGEENTLYIVEDVNASYRWNEATQAYLPIGVDVSVIDGGRADI